ncbi:MAG: carboxypeptidase-like regulatory domain-containing protein, partial [Muribaculaceae bacterium]|nr:carboxypeptidase-like regulatory domain-containing protein [Muribaculaceae bacterium]
MFQRYFYVIVLLLAGTLGVPAAVVKGVVTDLAGEPLPQATVRLLRADKDSTFVSAVASDLDGQFRFADVKKGRYLVQASYLGYVNGVSPVRIAADNAVMNLDSLKLRESGILLKEATVIGVATPVKVMEDTIEYNASSYTT